MRHADYAWAALAAAVVAYEAAAPDGQLLSEAVDRYREKHPLLTLGVICLIAAHLTRVIPRSLDPIHLAAVKLKPPTRLTGSANACNTCWTAKGTAGSSPTTWW